MNRRRTDSPHSRPITAAAATVLMAVTGIALWSSGPALGLAPDALLALGVLCGACILFFTALLPLGVTALAAPVVLSNDTILMFAGMYVVGQALFSSGAAYRLGAWIARISGGSAVRLVLGTAALTVLLSSLLSNTGTVAVLMPICIGVAERSHVSKKWLLFTLASASSTGGMITLVGTPPNATVHSVLLQAGHTGFGFFEFARIGAPISLVCVLFPISPLCRKLLSVPAPAQPADPAPHGDKMPHQGWTREQLTALTVLLGVVCAMASGWIPLGVAAVTAALLCVLLGTLTPKQAMASIDWSTLFLFSGTLALAKALEVTGVGAVLAEAAVSFYGGRSQGWLLITLLFLVCGITTQFMSNTAACALLAPIGLQIAQGLVMDPKGVLIVIAVAASSAFLTPMATPPNTLIFGTGGFDFHDFLKAGLPLFLLSYLLCLLLVPVMWPFGQI